MGPPHPLSPLYCDPSRDFSAEISVREVLPVVILVTWYGAVRSTRCTLVCKLVRKNSLLGWMEKLSMLAPLLSGTMVVVQKVVVLTLRTRPPSVPRGSKHTQPSVGQLGLSCGRQ